MADPNQQAVFPMPSKSASAGDALSSLKVIMMFRELGLPVCDDEVEIQQRVTTQRRARIRDTNNASPTVRERAKEWFQTAQALQSRRGELLQIVYDEWVTSADTSLIAARDAGLTVLSQDLIAMLQHIARESFHCTDVLAARFVARYLQQRGLRVSEPPFKRDPVVDFTARTSIGRVELSWKLPRNCLGIELYREEVTSAAEANRSGEPPAQQMIFRGSDLVFEDFRAENGKSYVYSAYSLFDHQEKGARVSRLAMSLGEVREATAEYAGGPIRLRWVSPSLGASVIVFRKRGARPLLNEAAYGWEPADDSTRQVLTADAATNVWDDYDVNEGQTYHYLLVADFGLGRFTQGVPCQAAVPVNPSAVSQLATVFQQDTTGIHVALQWTAASERRAHDYVVVRREGNVPPVGPSHGRIIHSGREVYFLDYDVKPGQRWSYAVFAHVGDVFSRTGATAPPVDILADVTDVEVVSGDQAVGLSWTVPDAAEVIICRGLSPPASQGDGQPVDLIGRNCALDTGLDNGRCYHYLIRCVYRPDGKTAQSSAGVRLQAQPAPLPDFVNTIRLYQQATDVVCQFEPPRVGKPKVLRSTAPLAVPIGHYVRTAELDLLGETVPLVADGKAIDRQPDINRPWYSLFIVSGDQALAGGRGDFAAYPDVTHFRLSSSRDRVLLRWQWPAECTSVIVARRQGTWPTGPTDSSAVCTPYSRLEYQDAGDRFVDLVGDQQGRFHYIVYARAPLTGGMLYAPGTGEGCRGEIDWRLWTELRYRLVRGKRKRELCLQWHIKDRGDAARFAGFVLWANQAWVPASSGDGIELFRWVPKGGNVAGSHQVVLSLDAIRQRGWARFYCKAIALDPAQEPTVLIIHPNTCMECGSILAGQRRRPNRRDSSVPRTIVCPHCLGTFPVREMLFGSYDRTRQIEPMRGCYTWLDRMRRRPPTPPSTKDGTRLTRKLCPLHAQPPRDLPFSAGVQESLLIGLIGAASSGKSHYIASLVQRLQTQVGNDLGAAVIHCTDETPRRYKREFYDFLFASQQEIPKTLGTPEPLIYDLSFDGSLWGENRHRTVTLALYDTAGENFHDPDRVRQTLQYLSVASGVILLIDPLQIPAVQSTVPASVPLPQLDYEADPNRILGNIITTLQNGNFFVGNSKLTIPVAVVLTKCDVLRDAGLLEPNRLWDGERRNIAAFDQELHDDVTGMFGEWVHRWNVAAYSTIVTRFHRYAFFGVSATGCASNRTTHLYPFVSPWRVEDPLIWLLAQLGIIPTKAEVQ